MIEVEEGGLAGSSLGTQTHEEPASGSMQGRASHHHWMLTEGERIGHC